MKKKKINRFSYLGSGDFKTRLPASGNEILSHVAVGKYDQGNKGGDHMSYRKHVSSNDNAIFNRTAVKTKRINLIATPTRGGFRL